MEETEYSDKPVLLSDGERMIKINLKDVSYIFVESVYCKMFTRSNHVLCKVRISLGALSEYLSKQVFVRVNQSAIINIWDVHQIMGHAIDMNGGMFVDISRRYASDVMKHFIILKENRPQNDL